MTTRRHDDGDLGDAIDAVIGETETALRRHPTPTTSRLLAGLDDILWEVARMQEAIRVAQLTVVTPDDLKALTKAFGRINREAETLVRWLRYTHLEQPRN